MSDQSPPDGAGQPLGDQPAQQGAPPMIQITAQYIKDLSFENPNAPRSLMATGAPPQVAINVDVRVNPLGGEQVFEVVLSLRADARHGDSQAFLVELAYGGVVTIGGLPQEHFGPVLLIEVPRMLFPFARAVIAQATREGGFPPLMVQPIDFVDLYRRQLMAGQPQGRPGQPGVPPSS